MIELKDAHFGYGSRPVVKAASLSITAGRCLGVVGPNGSGKTTLVRGIVGLLRPLTGTVERQGTPRFGYLPQHRALELHWPMTAIDAAGLSGAARQRLGWLGSSRQTLLESMRRLAVGDLQHRPFARLSGGQQQRVLLAGALAADPELLVLDEPTDGLDAQSRTLLLDALREQMHAGLGIVLISHAVEEVLAIGDSIAEVCPADQHDMPSTIRVCDPETYTRRVAAIRRPA